jgi:hypothetical protein
MPELSFVYWDVPPSLNRVASRGSRWAYSKAKREWQSNLEQLLMLVKLPRPVAHVEASAVLTFPVMRKRDEGNFRFMLEKALGDALVNGGWLEDDDADRFEFRKVRFQKGRRKQTEVTLKYDL